MLYFHFNKAQIADEKFEAIANNLGVLWLAFFGELSSIMPGIKCYSGSWSRHPQFKKYSNIYNEKWILCSVDEESVENSVEYILKCIEEIHSLKLDQYDDSLDEMGLHFDYVLHISNKEVDNAWADYMAENNFQWLKESIGNRNMTLPEKISFVSTELLNMGSEGNTLTIVDPYLFPKKHDGDYVELFEGIIEMSKVSNINVIIKKRNVNEKTYKNIKDRLRVPMNVYTVNDIHDRWWMIEETQRGISSGASLNGIGKGNFATITELPKNDASTCLKVIRTYYKRENILTL